MIGRTSEHALRDEAASWVMRLKDAHSLSDRRAFERWLAEDSANGPAYDRALARYDASGLLRTSMVGRNRDLALAFPAPSRNFWRGAAVASVAVLLLFGGFRLVGLNSLRPVALETVLLSSGDSARSVTLADGSKLGMGPASEIRLDFNRADRIAEVRKGHVRLIVARERRPFRIVAAESTQQAETGIFDAEVVAGHGVIVSNPTFESGSPGSGPASRASDAARPARQRVEFAAEPLGEVVAQINRVQAGPRIEFAPDLAKLRVTGVFQQGRSETVARSLALAFDLKLVRTPSGTLLLTHQK